MRVGLKSLLGSYVEARLNHYDTVIITPWLSSWFSDSQKTLLSQSLWSSWDAEVVMLQRSTASAPIQFWHLGFLPFFSLFHVVQKYSHFVEGASFQWGHALGKGLTNSCDLISSTILFIAVWTGNLFLAQFQWASMNNSGNVTYSPVVNVSEAWPDEKVELAEKKVLNFSLRSCVMVASQWFTNLFNDRIIFSK